MGIFVCKGCGRSSTNQGLRGRPLKEKHGGMCSNCYNKLHDHKIKINCVKCGKETKDFGYKHCTFCYDNHVRVKKECVGCGEIKRIVCNNKCTSCRMMERRVEAYSHYCDGDIQCACCDEKEIDFLTLDHINNDGAQHRKFNPNTGRNLVGYVMKNNYPKGYQILCMNCNFSKAKPRNKGKCIHHA